MTRALSQLIYAPFQPGSGGKRVITFHRHNEFTESMKPAGCAISPTGSVTGLQSSKAVYNGRDVIGYTWYIGPLHQPSPIFFGDALSDIERFLWDEIDRGAHAESGLPFLVGAEQGGTMAIATALAVPDLISGVIAIDAMLPTVPGWDPPLAPLDGMPILLVNPVAGYESDPTVLTGETLAAQLTAWGGTVEILRDTSNPIPTGAIAEWLGQQSARIASPG